jgi:serine/threonine protein kinase
MGNCASSDSKFDPTIAIGLNDFEMKYPIGRGGFGRVWKVYHKKTSQLFAMKEMRKDLIVAKRSVGSIMNERRLLGILKHPFLVNLHYAFQNLENLYLVVDLMSGGDFRYYLVQRQDMKEGSIKFLAACILCGLEYLHLNNIVHRDIKPENLVFDSSGYVHITDFGIARMSNADNSSTTSGTPGYMSPEVLCSQNHGIAADYFALGVILYECITHFRPYTGKNRKEIRDAVLNKQVQLKLENNLEWTNELIDLVNRLIQRKPDNRLGFSGPAEVKNHKFFEGFDWEKLYNKELESPFKISEKNNFDYDHVMKKWDPVKERITAHNSQKLFAGYLYDATLFSMQKPNYK